MPSHGPQGYRCIPSDFEFAREQLLHTFFALDDHYWVYRFCTDLRSPAPACNPYERRRTPTLRCPACGHTLAVLRSEDESPFYQMGYDRYALCPLHNLVGNALVRRGHDLV